MKTRIYRALAVLLAFALAGTTEVAQAWQTAAPAQQQQNASQQTIPAQQDAKPADQPTQQPAQPQQPDQPQAQPQQQTTAPDATKENNASDPTYVPAPGQVLPNAPGTQQDQPTGTATPSSNPQAQQPQKEQQPLGTAAAEKGVTTGGAASKPAGIAVAGKKQNQSRGLLIKVGAALAAGAALGTVYALSRGTSPVPPGAAH